MHAQETVQTVNLQTQSILTKWARSDNQRLHRAADPKGRPVPEHSYSSAPGTHHSDFPQFAHTPTEL